MNAEGPAPGGPRLVLASRGSVAPGHRTGVRVNGLALGSLHLKAERPLQTHISGKNSILGHGLTDSNEER